MPRYLRPDDVAAILGAGTFDTLPGAVEDEHFECKGAPYQLQQDVQKLELAKDVSAFANLSARTEVDGGYLLIGVETRKSPEHHGDVVSGVNPFEQRLVDPGSYYRVLNDWLHPMPDGLDIRWYPTDRDHTRGILVIRVPRQRPDSWPFLVTRALDDPTGRTLGHMVGYFERHRDDSVHYSPADLHRFLRDGRRADALITGELAALAGAIQEVRSAQGVVPPAAEPVGLPPVHPVVPQAGPSEASQSYRQRRNHAIAAASMQATPVFALTAAPVQTITLPTLFRGRNDPLVQLLAHPPELRAGGFSVNVGDTANVEGRLRRAVVPGRMILECWQDGTLIFAAEDDYLCWGTQIGSLRINPLALAESTYLFAELAQRVYQHATPQPEALEFGLALLRMERPGTRAALTPGPLGSFAFQFGRNVRQAPAHTHEISVPVEGVWSPRVVAYRLVAAVYTWFGFEEDEVPYVAEEAGQRMISADMIRTSGR